MARARWTTCPLARAAIALALLPALTGCVVEEIRRPGYSTPKPQPVSLDGPIATPIPDATMSARVRVEVRPLGSVHYDGLVLPMLSPDGRYVAVQDGVSPDWPTILATDGATVPLRTRLRVYDITGGSPEEIRVNLPDGLLLGRSADDRGFLVESPRPDGARWIGRVSWRGGELEWLVKDENVSAHAVLTPEGLLVHTSRGVGEPAAALVLRDRAMRRLDGLTRQGGGTFLFPVCTSEPGVVYALTGGERGLGLEAIRIAESGLRQGALVFGAVEASKVIASHASPSLAYQCLAGLGYGLPSRESADETLASPLLIFHPRLERIVTFDRRTNSIAMLPDGTSAGVRSPYAHAPGYFLSTPEELIFTPGVTDSGREAPVASILSDPYLPRLTTSAERPLMMLGFGTSDPLQINLLALYVPTEGGGDAE